MKEEKTKTYLYLAKSFTGCLKVGISKNPVNRALNLQYDQPGGQPIERSLLIIHCGPGDWPHERQLHRLLHLYRIPKTSEWYSDCPEVRKIARDFIDRPFVIEAEKAMDLGRSAAVELGRLGGKKKFANMTPEQIRAYQKDVALRGWETRRKKGRDDKKGSV